LYWIQAREQRFDHRRTEKLSILCIGFARREDVYTTVYDPGEPAFNSLYWIQARRTRINKAKEHFQFFVLDSPGGMALIGALLLSILCIGFLLPADKANRALLSYLSILCIGFPSSSPHLRRGIASFQFFVLDSYSFTVNNAVVGNNTLSILCIGFQL